MALPRAGSFRDVVLQEMDLRERDIRYTEALLLVTVIELLGRDILNVLMAGFKLEGKRGFTPERVDKLVRIYRDKVFHHGYLPDYEKRLNEVLSGKGGKMRERTAAEVEALRRLETLTDRDPI